MEVKAMRIAFCGCQGVGKTTAASELARLLGLKFLDDGSDLVRLVWPCQEFAPIFDGLVSDKQRFMRWQRLLLSWRSMLHAENDDFVSARCVLDVVAYSIYGLIVESN